jgi:hypothetical protein
MSNLVYFASGSYKDEYQNLPYDFVYLVDKYFEHEQSILRIGKVICLKMDALIASEYLIKNRITIDCFVSINEGLFGGGGNYVINSDAFMGYVFPILKDEYIHIIDRSYYTHPYIVKMNWPISKKELKVTDCRFIHPIFFASANKKKLGNVYLINKKRNCRQLKMISNKKVFVINDSIWSDYNRNDLFCLSINNPNTNNFFYSKSNVLNIRNYNFCDVLAYCEMNKILKIRLLPWLQGQYQAIIDLILEHKNTYPEEIYFYHFNKNDYKSFREK